MNVSFGLEALILIPALVQGAGFCLLLLGSFTYDEVIVWKFLGLHKQTKAFLSENQGVNGAGGRAKYSRLEDDTEADPEFTEILNRRRGKRRSTDEDNEPLN